jgi:N-acetylmuramoyl-L-alanine amidase
MVCAGVISVGAEEGKTVAPVVVLDPGHNKKNPGALSVSGIFEVAYNDNLVQQIAAALSQVGFKVIVTRQVDQEMDLDARVKKANGQKTLALLSIHHDSAQLIHLEKIQRSGREVYRTREPIRGYSIFISSLNPKYKESLQLAHILGEALLDIGRKPTLHHAEPIRGENRPLLDQRLGIYKYDDLKILKKAKAPAVLLEFGVLVDEEDEAYVANETNQRVLADIIQQALNRFVSLSRNHNQEKYH